jgi:hypothetical protein
MKLIADERKRQVDVEGWTAAHDDEHVTGELLRVAVCYLNAGRGFETTMDARGVPVGWPWDPKWWKPKDARSNLIRAGALCLAESERLQRLDPNRSRSPAGHKLDLAVKWLASLPA